MGEKGFSLVELIVVIATMIILTSIATLQFSSMMRKREVEKQVRMMYTDLTEVRQKALYEKTSRAVRLTANEFKVYPEASTADTPVLRRALNYPVGWSNSDAVVDIVFNTFGISNNDELFVCIAGGSDAPVDSLRLTATRVDLAKKTGADCDSTGVSLK